MAKIEVTILGTTAGVPTRERAHPAIYLVYRGGEEFCYLFDCGEGTQRQILFANLNFMKINEIFITHWHGDHYLGLPGLVDTMGFENRKKPLTIFAPDVKRAKALLNIGYFSREFKIILKDVPDKGKSITQLVDTDDFKIVSTPVEHFVPAVGYAFLEKDKILIDKEKIRRLGLPDKGIIYREIKEKGRVIFKGKEIKLENISKVRKGKKVVYSGDTKICDNLIKLAENADLLIQDCTYFNFDGESFEDYGHASFEDVLGMMKKIKVKKIILTHISRRYKDKEKLKKMIKVYPDLEIAEDFMKISV
ncbi:MAG TPA: ribonuclease Z [Candidatus Aerophobetes bacterium]|uniref:Ribonuclease Z n=1 Tax=Aerophobetes bacterium TaxID=2030807 RepID=A0A7V0N256_UNCAE|nr:ribonuclease Z [Candidatus Aerophobetes bacterium]